MLITQPECDIPISLCQPLPFLQKHGVSCFKYYCSLSQSIHHLVSFRLYYNPGITQSLNLPFKVKAM